MPQSPIDGALDAIAQIDEEPARARAQALGAPVVDILAVPGVMAELVPPMGQPQR